MPTRLIKFLRKHGLSVQATDEQVSQYVNALAGRAALIAAALAHPSVDVAGSEEATAADTMLRSLGLDPADPSQGAPAAPANAPAAAPAPAATIPGDGADTGTQRITQVAPIQAIAPAPPAEDPVATERARVTQIRTIGRDAGVPEETIDAAIDGGHTLERAQTDFLAHFRQSSQGVNADLGGAPAAHTRNSVTGYTAEGLAAAMMIGRCGINDPTRHYRDYSTQHRMFSGARELVSGTPEYERAHRASEEGQRLSSLSTLDIAIRCLALDGRRCESIPEAVMETRAAIGSGTLDVVFTQTFGAQMLESYDRTEDTTQGWVGERDNPNFFQMERGRMGHMPALTKHAKGGTADMMEVSDTKAFARIQRYSGKYVLDEIDLINNTWGGMLNGTDVLRDYTPREMGVSAAQTRPDLIYALLMSNPNSPETGAALFSGTHNNLKTGALSKANIQELVTAMALQQEGDVNINLRPRYLIVPEMKVFDAREALRQAAMISGDTSSSDERLPSYNALSQVGLQIRHDSRLDNGVVDPDSGDAVAGDPDAYYLATEGDGRTIECTYRTGASRSPQVRNFTRDGGQWLVGWDVKLDIGASLIGHRGMAKSTGQ